MTQIKRRVTPPQTKMIIQVDITEKDLIQKLQMCVSLNVCVSIVDDVKPKYSEKLYDISKQIESSGNYQEIYNELHQIEKMLVEQYFI